MKGTRKRLRSAFVVPSCLVLGVAFLNLLLGGHRDTYFKCLKQDWGTGMCSEIPDVKESDEAIFGIVSKYFNISDPTVEKFTKLIHGYLKPWSLIKVSNNRSIGGIRRESLEFGTSAWNYMRCSGHVRIIKGKLFYRFGGFYNVWYQMSRFLQSLKLIQDAIDNFDLKHLTMEFLINTCDNPRSFLSGYYSDRAGIPVFSPFVSSDSLDIPIPDQLDFSPTYGHHFVVQIPWSQKRSRAVFRGATTNYDLKDCNWGPNPRIRVHKMSKYNLEDFDARVNRWSHVGPTDKLKMGKDGIFMASHMNFSSFNSFKYQVVVDGGAGSSRTCGVLRSNQLVLRQRTHFNQFFEPLIRHGRHVIQVNRLFSDLQAAIRWARKYDEKVQLIVKSANELAEEVCTWQGRMMYWAVLLVKYQEVLRDFSHLKEPTNICKIKSPIKELEVPVVEIPCNSPNVTESQPHDCIYFCVNSKMDTEAMVWMTHEDLVRVERYGPGADKYSL